MDIAANLSAEDREFFSLIARGVSVNPFSDERDDVDGRIVGHVALPEIDSSERARLLAAHVKERIGKFDAQGLGTIRAFSDDERRLVEYAHLFYVYHHLIDEFDALIQTQLEMRETPAPVPFARDALSAFTKRGFAKAEAVRYFSLFYQLRRAFYFIRQGLVGKSPSMKALRRALWNNVFTHDIHLYDEHLWNRMEDFSTLLLGETGTGKGTGAAAIGRSGYIPFDEKKGAFKESFTRTFVAINLSQFTPTLIESELFGHRKGAFTGAVDDHDGVFALCSPHGALFLDEIGEVSVPIQIKLLQVLEARTFSPVGSHAKKRFEGRVIAATNLPIEAIRSAGRFRDDFFYRLSSDVIVFPPLRQRLGEDRAELDELIASAVRRITGEASSELTAMASETIERELPSDYPWPGNVRELEQAVRRILLTSSYKGDLKAQAPDELGELLCGIESGSLDAAELMSRYCSLLYRRHGTYEEVARRTNLDRRTVKKHVERED